MHHQENESWHVHIRTYSDNRQMYCVLYPRIFGDIVFGPVIPVRCIRWSSVVTECFITFLTDFRVTFTSGHGFSNLVGFRQHLSCSLGSIFKTCTGRNPRSSAFFHYRIDQLLNEKPFSLTSPSSMIICIQCDRQLHHFVQRKIVHLFHFRLSGTSGENFW